MLYSFKHSRRGKQFTFLLLKKKKKTLVVLYTSIPIRGAKHPFNLYCLQMFLSIKRVLIYDIVPSRSYSIRMC